MYLITFSAVVFWCLPFFQMTPMRCSMDGMTGDPDEIGMCFYNRTIQEGSYVTGFDHIDESGDLAGVEDDMWSHTDCLELSGQCHDLHRVCIKKDQRFICEHGKKNRLLFCERMIRCDTEIKILCINDAGVTLIDRGLFRIDDRNSSFSSRTSSQALIEPNSKSRKSTSGKFSFRDRYNSGR